MIDDYTGVENEENYDPFTHVYPMLLGTESGFVEIMVAFVIVKGGGDFDKMGTAIPLEPGDHDDLPIETRKRFEIPEDFFSGKAQTVENSGFWILPAVISARRLVGPLEENMPGGEGGEPISPTELVEVMVNVDFLEVFTTFRECVVESKFAPKRLLGILDRFIGKYEN